MSETTVRIAFDGTGLIAWAHALALRAMADAGVVPARIVSCTDAVGERAQGFAAVCGCEAIEDPADLFRDADAVYVCTPTSSHRQWVELAAAAGKAVFCEKPLATDLAGAESLAASLRTAGVPAQVGLVLRSIPVFGELVSLVQGGTIGRPMAAVMRDDQYFPIQGHYSSSWRADVTAAGGGALLEHSIHDVDMLRLLLGPVQSVSCSTANFAGHEAIEDSVTALLRMRDGASVTLASVWHQILSRGSTRRLEVICEQGMAWLEDDVAGPLMLQTSAGVETRQTPLPAWVRDLPLADDRVGLAVRSYAMADRDFVEAVATGSAPHPGVDEALASHRIVDALYRSAGSGGALVEGPF